MIRAAAKHAPELYYVGRRSNHPRAAVADVARLLISLFRKELRVVYLMQGDPLALGSGTELVTALHDSDIRFEIVPGVSAVNATATYSGIPLLAPTMASAAVVVNGRSLTRGAARSDWSAIAKTGATVVVHNAESVLPAIIAGYAAAGVDGDIPAAAIVDAGLPTQRAVVATLGTIGDSMQRASSMSRATVIIGWTVLLRDELSWFETRPLFGRRIIVAHARHGPQTISALLRDMGAVVIDVPSPGVARLDLEAVRDAIDELSAYDWIVFSSPDAVSIFWEQLILSGRDTRALARAKVACAGPATAAALLDRGVTVDVAQEKFGAVALIDDFSERVDIPGAAMLYVADDSSAEPFGRDLEAAGATVTPLALYREVPVAKLVERFQRSITERHVDLVVAMSASAAEDYVRAAGEHALSLAPAAVHDAATGQVLRDAGIDVVIEPSAPDTDGLVDSIRARLQDQRQPR
jgi:uroporphyrinogen III methyltransferase/synthase